MGDRPPTREWKYTPLPRKQLTGNERFKGIDTSVIDFWRWGAGDLMTNTARGILAEFLVAKAVGDERPTRLEWDNFDVLTPEGVKIEVKTSALLQAAFLWPGDPWRANPLHRSQRELLTATQENGPG